MADRRQIRGGVQGMAPLLQKLALMASQAFVGRTGRKAMTAVTIPIKNTAKGKIEHHETGMLKLSIGQRVNTYRQSGTTVGVVGPRSGFKKVRGKPPQKTPLRLKFEKVGQALGFEKGRIPTYYAHLVEFGTRPHALGKGSSLKKGLAWGRMHPGARPKPFMRPAWDEHRRSSERIMADVIMEELKKV